MIHSHSITLRVSVCVLAVAVVWSATAASFESAGSRASVQAVFVDVLDSNDPTFDRRDEPATADPSCNAVSSDAALDGQFYDVICITVTDTSPVEIEVTSGNFDTFLLLYCDLFDAGDPAANLIFGDDDDGASGLSAIFASDNVTLTPGNDYRLVLTSAAGGQTGNYRIETSSNVEPSCIVAVEESAWGKVKTLYQE